VRKRASERVWGREEVEKERKRNFSLYFFLYLFPCPEREGGRERGGWGGKRERVCRRGCEGGLAKEKVKEDRERKSKQERDCVCERVCLCVGVREGVRRPACHTNE